MLLTGAGCVLMALILYISGVNGEEKSICVLRGSSVDLPCSAQEIASNRKWYTVHHDGQRRVQKELFADETHVRFNMSNKGLPTLTINDVRENDANLYCCSSNANNPELCKERAVQLIVSDLQVKVIPDTEGQTVALMCSTSCPLTEKPAAYIWYKNREFLYKDWSPWYQELVSSEEAVTYSCAVKGYEDLRAPEVSVDSVTPTCFNVTYAKGRMCSNQTSVDESCSITYPRHYKVQVQGKSPVVVSCTTSCPVSDRQTTYRWYQNRRLSDSSKEFSTSSTESLSCAVKGQDHLLSPEVCPEVNNCWTVNYISRRICAVKGSSVNISSEYSHPHKRQPKSKSWYKVETSGEQLIKAAGRMEYHDMKNQHILTIKDLKKNDSAEYKFTLQKDDDEERKRDDVPGVTLVVTDLKVQLRSAAVTEGQRVTLTCKTSCPLPRSTNYIWYFNSQPLNLTHDQSKHLLLDPVSSQDAGNYYCSVKTGTKRIYSREKTLTVQRTTGTLVAAVGVGAALLVVILLGVIYWFRKKRTSGQVPTTEATDNTEQLNDAYTYENISAESTQHDELHYIEVQFSKNQTDATYATVQPHQLNEEEQATYAVVSFRPNMNPE